MNSGTEGGKEGKGIKGPVRSGRAKMDRAEGRGNGKWEFPRDLGKVRAVKLKPGNVMRQATSSTSGN